MPLTLITAPTDEPITLEEAKVHLRVVDDEDDLLIMSLITAARQYAEQITQRSLCTQTWQLTADAFPGPSLMGVPYGRVFGIPAHAFLLERGPVQSVTSIKYDDMAGVEQTMPPAQYKAELASEPARVTPVFGQIWPINLPQIGSVRVRYVAGYGGPEDVPAGIRQWMLMRIGALYEHREEVAAMNRGTLQPLEFVDRLLDQYRVVTY